jgi:RecB family endonuclease NucS
MEGAEDVEVEELSPLAWRLLRVAAGFEQRAIEREVDDLMQAHISMLESGTRALSVERRRALLELYVAELDSDQIRAIADNF